MAAVALDLSWLSTSMAIRCATDQAFRSNAAHFEHLLINQTCCHNPIKQRVLALFSEIERLVWTLVSSNRLNNCTTERTHCSVLSAQSRSQMVKRMFCFPSTCTEKSVPVRCLARSDFVRCWAPHPHTTQQQASSPYANQSIADGDS